MSHMQKIHALAKEAVEAYNAGDKEKAEKIYEQMEEVSKQIINLLDQIKMEQKTLNSNTKKQIDHLGCMPYNLSEEEIEIVEKA